MYPCPPPPLPMSTPATKALSFCSCFQTDLVKIKCKNSALGASEVAQSVKAHAVMGEETSLCKLFSDLHILAMAYML